MSTRCQIGILGDVKADKAKPEVLLYRHSDGYPGTVDGKEYGVLADIVPFLLDFNKRRGITNSVDYCGAWLMHHLISKSIEHMRAFNVRLAKATGKPVEGNEIDYLGYGIDGDKQFHGDIEYYYAVYPDRVEVWDVDGHSPKDWKKTFTVYLINTEKKTKGMQVRIDGKKKMTADAIV